MFGTAVGAEVTVFSRNPDKEEDARKMGAVDFQEGLGHDYAPSFDYVLSTIDIAEKMPLADIISTVDINGELHICAMPDDELKFPSRSISSNHTGSKKEPQGMLQLAADKGIEAWKQVIPMKDVGKGVQAVKESKVRYRTSPPKR
ncbi:SPOSA6832_01717 [Sporobolomyces salmonicolor]|uniref:SPOSA6832_01717-mRNA-1:cds n=1 Tax=Sporidiobolus salmonicolor TaxID=5005 RepID=A0A0D6EJG2_SPOSA|nr:SPOSA6832_01717 [Sporobolomyces salmonicolor]